MAYNRMWLSLFIAVSAVFVSGESNTLLCGRARAIELSNTGVSSAVALTLVRPRTPEAVGPCRLRLVAPTAAAFSLRIIDVEDPFSDFKPPLGIGSGLRKWGSQGKTEPTVAQDTDAPNKTEPCVLSVYISDARSPVWKVNPCSWTPMTSVAILGSARLLPTRLRISWTPPTSSHFRTERLRLVVTVVNSGEACKENHMFPCGKTDLCVSRMLMCDDVRHCPGGEDEDQTTACSQLEDVPPLIELLRRLAARHQEMLGLEPPTIVTQATTVDESTAKNHNRTVTTIAALEPYGPWGYIVLGMLICATMLMFCALYECCCKRDKPEVPGSIPPACLAPAASDATGTGALDRTGAQTAAISLPPPAYELLEQPPSYSTLFPRALSALHKFSSDPLAHSSQDDQPPPD